MIKLILFILLFATPAIAADSFYTIENFSGGVKSHVSEYLMKEDSAVVAQNVRINDKFGELSKRPVKLNLAVCHASPVKSLYRYYKSNDTKHTIATASTYVDAIDSNGTCIPLSDSVSEAKRWSFVTYKDILIGMNGTNNAKKWDGMTTSSSDTLGVDGDRTANNLMADLGAPFAELNTGTNLTASKWYQYRVAYYNGSYYTYSLSRSNPIQTGASVRDITLTDIPLGPAGTTHRYIYRTLGKATRADVLADNTFYKIATIADNATTTTNDAMVDGTADDDAVPTWTTVSAGYAVTPPKAKYAVINQERLFIANDPSGTIDGKSTIYYTPVLKQDYFYYHTDYELIRPDDGDEITFIKNLLGTLTVGKTRTISKYYTEGATTNWSVSDPYSFIGCTAPWSATNGITGIIYASRYGIYNFSGQSSTLMSDVVTDKIRDILETNQGELVGTYHDNNYYLSYTSSESGAANNDKVLVLDITRNAYVEDTTHVDSFASYDAGDDSGVLYSGSSEIDGGIYSYGESYSKLNYRYLSQLIDGTLYNSSLIGDQESPILSLGSNETWADLGAGTWADSGDWTWLTHSLTGTWTSPIVQINAETYDKLLWNEALGTYGNVTFAVRSGSTSAACSVAAWSSEFTDPTGSDISALTAGAFVQIRASLASTSWTETPLVFVENSYMIRLVYKKSGDSKEPSYLSLWKGGKKTLGTEASKRVKEIQIYYSGDVGTLNVSYQSEDGVNRNFDIDLSVSPSINTRDQYFGTSEEKIFVHIPSFEDQPAGRVWQFAFSDNGTEQWKVKRIVVRAEALNYNTYQGEL